MSPEEEPKEGSNKMVRVLLTCFLMVSAAFAQPTGTTKPAGQASPPPKASPAPMATPVPGPQQVASDAAVITIRGVCASGDPKSADCKTIITKQKFEGLLGATMSGNQPPLAGAVRAFALNYAQLTALGTAAEKSGVEKSSQFLELMQLMRLRALSESYRKVLLEQYKNPPQEEVAAYYKEHFNQYFQLGLERVFIPRANPRGPRETAPAFEQRAQKLAGEIRERASKGEDMGNLQIEAYKTLGLPPAMSADLGTRHRGTLPSGIDEEVFALKPGQVTKVEIDPSGFSIYKVRTDSTIPVDRVKDEISLQIAKTKAEATIQSAMAPVQTDLNEQYFAPSLTATPPITPRTGTKLPAMPNKRLGNTAPPK
jgi:hypothetical protein